MNDSKTATLTLPDGQTVELPVVTGTEQEKAIDISQLRKLTGYITLDDGYANTGACTSAITFIDGEKGILRYRGVPIEELALHSSFLETSFLLIYGELPSRLELEEFERKVTDNSLIHEDMKNFYDGFPRDAHPMAILSSAVSACYTFYQDWENPRDKQKQDLGIVRLLGKLPTMAAFAYKKSRGEPFIYPRHSLSYAANYVHMMFASPARDYAVDPEIAAGLDLLLILHADHEQNCSTSAARLVGSSLSNLYSSISAAIAALWGPRHGGANQKVIEMLREVANGGSLDTLIRRAKDKSDPFVLYGFGHRVYKNRDPRSNILKESCHKILRKLNMDDPLFEIALQLEEIALKDEYFIERNLYPNVDFYSGIIYSALGIPTNSFTSMFALGRLPGWIAQWREMINSPEGRIARPRQIYVGSTKRPYVPLDER